MSTLYWENFDRKYEDFEKEGLNFDDLLVKSKFLFLNGKYTFSSKSKFNFGAKNSAVHEYGIKHKTQSHTLEFKHKANGEISFEADAKCVEKDQLTMRTLSKITLDQGENRKNVNADVMMRFHHKNNALLSLGVENWSPLKGSPETFSFYTSYGHNAEVANVSFNTYFNFNVTHNFLPQAKFLMHGQKGDTTGYLQANLNRKQVETDDIKTPKVIAQAVDLVLKVVQTFNSKTKLAGSVRYNLDDKKTDATIVASHLVDRVKINAKLSTDRSFSVGVTSVFDDVTLSFAAKSVLKTATEKVGEAETTKHWADFKFGLSAEFNRL
jgi:hypothetical protein